MMDVKAFMENIYSMINSLARSPCEHLLLRERPVPNVEVSELSRVFGARVGVLLDAHSEVDLNVS